MKRPVLLAFALAAVTLATVLSVRAAAPPASPNARSATRVFELRTYHTYPGRFDALLARFRDHTCGLFKKHGMQMVGYWTPAAGQPGHGDTLVYLLAFPTRDAADASWKAFRDDPEWKAAKEASENDGPIVSKVESVFLDPTDFSSIN